VNSCQTTGATTGDKKMNIILTALNKTNRFNGAALYVKKGKVLYKKAFCKYPDDSNVYLYRHFSI
jgi:hypothetical protein